TRQVQVSGKHVIAQNLALAGAVAKQHLEMTPVEMPVNAEAEHRIAEKLQDLAFKPYIVLNPGAGWGAKQWPVDRYGQVARILAQQTGLLSLINFGPGEEALACATEASSAGTAKAITTSISELIALIRRARLVIGGDTGPVHLAAMLGIPVVAIFGPTNPARNGPIGAATIVLRKKSSETSYKRIRHSEAGLLKIAVDEVLGAAIQLLEENRDSLERGGKSHPRSDRGRARTPVFLVFASEVYVYRNLQRVCCLGLGCPHPGFRVRAKK